MFFFTLLENMSFTSVIYDFQHQLLTDFESTDVESIIVNIDFLKPMLSYTLTYVFLKKLMLTSKR